MSKNRELLWSAVSGVVAVCVGFALGTVPGLVLGVALAAVATVFMMRAPAWAYAVVLVSVSAFINVYAYPRLGSLVFVSELLLLVAVASCTAKYVGLVRSGELRVDWVTGLIGLFFVACVAGVPVGVAHGVALSAALSAFRPMLYLLAVIPALVAVSTDQRARRLVLFAAVLAFLVSVASVIQVLVGPSILLFNVEGFEALIRADPATGFLRVRPPGLYLVYAAAAWALCRLIWGPGGRGRPVAGAVLLASLTGIALSFNRNMMVGLVLGVCVAFLSARRKGRAVALVLLVGVLLLGGLMLLDQSDFSQPVVSRFASLFDSGVRGSALNDRAVESAAALQSVSRQPILGLGWGPGYGAVATRLSRGTVTTFERPWIHNQFLSFWVRAGILGALVLVMLYGIAVVSAGRNSRVAPADEYWIDLALVASITAFALSSLVDIVVANPNNLVVLVGLLAMVSARSHTLGRRGSA